MSEKIFTNGLIVKRSPKAPQFVVASLSFKTDEFRQFLLDNDKNGWVNVDVKLSREGKYYAELNTWTPDSQERVTQETSNQSALNQEQKDERAPVEYPEEELSADDIPF